MNKKCLAISILLNAPKTHERALNASNARRLVVRGNLWDSNTHIWLAPAEGNRLCQCQEAAVKT